MAVQFSNGGVTIKVITPTYDKDVQKDIVKFSINETTREHISIRAGKYGDQFRYTDITSPVTSNIDALLVLLESWLEMANGGGIVFDSAQVDTAGRLPVALPVVLGDYKFIRNLLPEHFSVVVNGTGAVSHNAATNSADLTTGAIGDWALIVTNQWHPYFNGKSQQPLLTYINLAAETGAEKRIGYYHSSTSTPFNTVLDGMSIVTKTDGNLYFEIHRDGTEVLSVAQSDWNGDKLDGSGPSGKTLDLVNFQVTYWDFLYLGGTKSVLRFFIEGAPIIAHTYGHSNTKANTIIGTPSQPLRAEVRQIEAGSATLKFLCGEVTSNGDDNQLVGFPVAFMSGLTRINLATGVRRGILKYRLKSGYRDLAVFQEVINTVTNGAAGNTYIWELRLNQTTSAGTWGAWTDTDKEGIEYAVGAASVVLNDDGYFINGGNGAARADGGGAVSKLRRLGTQPDGTADEFVISMIGQDNNLAGHVVINTNVL